MGKALVRYVRQERGAEGVEGLLSVHTPSAADGWLLYVVMLSAAGLPRCRCESGCNSSLATPRNAHSVGPTHMLPAAW